MTPIILALVPIAVTFLTSVIKRVPFISNVESQSNRNLIIRSIAALLSLGGIVGAFMMSGQNPNPAALQDIVTTLSLAFMAFLGSVGGHEVAKAR